MMGCAVKKKYSHDCTLNIAAYALAHSGLNFNNTIRRTTHTAKTKRNEKLIKKHRNLETSTQLPSTSSFLFELLAYTNSTETNDIP